MPNQKITEAVLDKLVLNLKTIGYKKALDIARLILLHYHPGLSQGRNDVLVLMFDMNLLWEQFVLVSLRKTIKDYKVTGQNYRGFWKPHGGNTRAIRPDITISANDKKESYILDTKWKLVDRKPSIEDIRQMYAYHHYFNAEKVALLYPGNDNYVMGNFVDIKAQNPDLKMECGLMFTEFQKDVRTWQDQIGKHVLKWIKPNE